VRWQLNQRPFVQLDWIALHLDPRMAQIAQRFVAMDLMELEAPTSTPPLLAFPNPQRACDWRLDRIGLKLRQANSQMHLAPRR